jgi:hypothetical protein
MEKLENWMPQPISSSEDVLFRIGLLHAMSVAFRLPSDALKLLFELRQVFV